MELIQNLFEKIKVLSNVNPVVASVISLYSLGVVTYFCRDVPKKILDFLKKHLTTTLILTSSHEVFHNFMSWIEMNNYSDKFRRIKLTNGRWGCNRKTVRGIGYGSHLFSYNSVPMIIDLSKEQTNSDVDKETLTITKFGRSHKVFNEMINKFLEVKEDDRIKIYTYRDGWNLQQKQYRRDFKSVFIEKYKRELLVKTLADFSDREEWYLKHGVPYRLGIILYGSPGTGKTSLIKAIASYLGKDLYILKASTLLYLSSAIESLPYDSIMVIEDIDSNISTHVREGIKVNEIKQVSNNQEKVDVKESSSKSKQDDIKLINNLLGGGLSEILNSIDGIVDTHGRILILTTNRIKKLDPALLRPGRIDLKLEVGFVNEEIFRDFCNSFFPGSYLKRNIKVKSHVTVAELQQAVLMGKSVEEICLFFLVKDSC